MQLEHHVKVFDVHDNLAELFRECARDSVVCIRDGACSPTGKSSTPSNQSRYETRTISCARPAQTGKSRLSARVEWKCAESKI
jgi:hypothetical protein